MALFRVEDEFFNVIVDGPADAPAVMLSNSLGTDHRMWEPQIAELKRHFRVIRYDSRGHGRSAADAGPYSIAGLGRDAIAILDALGIDKTHWIGLSKGGMIGQWLLANAPHRIDRAVLANTGARMGPPDVWNGRIRAARESGMRALSSGTLERWFTKDFHARHPETVEAVRDMFHDTPAHGYAASCAAIRDMDQREAIRSIRGKPVLVIVGRHDPATPPAMGELIAGSIAGAKLVALDAAHMSNIEDAAGFTRAVVEFLTRAPATAKPSKTSAGSKSRAVKSAAKKAAKRPAKKAAAKRSAAKKTTTKKAAAKKAPPKAAAKRPAAKKTATKKSAPRKAAKTKTAPRKSVGKGAAKSSRRAVSKPRGRR